MYKCKNFALTALGILMLSSSAFSEERRVIRPDDIRTPLVPTAHIGGDTDFGGNGPNITITVDVLPGNQGRTLVANVTFHAKETKPDHSEVVGRWSNIVIHTLPGDLRIARIAGETHTRLTHRSSRGATPGSSTVTLGRTEDGGVIVTKTPQRQGQSLIGN